MANRRIDMHEYKEVIYRLRLKQSLLSISLNVTGDFKKA